MTLRLLTVLSATVGCFTDQECVLWLVLRLHATGGSDRMKPALPSIILPCVSPHQPLCLLRNFQLTVSYYSEPWLPWKAQAVSSFLCHSCSPCFWWWLLRDASEQSSVCPLTCSVHAQLHNVPFSGITFCPEAWKLLLLIFTCITLAAVIGPKVICCPFQTSSNVYSSDLLPSNEFLGWMHRWKKNFLNLLSTVQTAGLS